MSRLIPTTPSFSRSSITTTSRNTKSRFNHTQQTQLDPSRLDTREYKRPRDNSIKNFNEIPRCSLHSLDFPARVSRKGRAKKHVAEAETGSSVMNMEISKKQLSRCVHASFPIKSIFPLPFARGHAVNRRVIRMFLQKQAVFGIAADSRKGRLVSVCRWEECQRRRELACRSNISCSCDCFLCQNRNPLRWFRNFAVSSIFPEKFSTWRKTWRYNVT